MKLHTQILIAGIFTLVCNLANIAKAKPGDARKENEVSAIVVIKTTKVCDTNHENCKEVEKKVDFIHVTKAQLIKAD